MLTAALFPEHFLRPLGPETMMVTPRRPYPPGFPRRSGSLRLVSPDQRGDHPVLADLPGGMGLLKSAPS
jgi:hypothetical protein